MITLPMRFQDSSPSRQSSDSYDPSLPPRPRNSHISGLQRHVAGAMLSVMPSSRPTATNRPKLSLQTSKLSSPAVAGEFPTIRSTNVLDAPPPTPTSTVQPQIHFPPSATSSAFPGVFHFPNDAPYFLPIGTRSILRNSPLPRRHLSATSTRTPKRMFPPMKRVAFQERLVEFTPTPVIEGLSDTEFDTSSSEDEHKRRREVIEAEDGHRRRKRQDWVWRPVEDDVLTLQDSLSVDSDLETPPIQAQLDVVNVRFDSRNGEGDVAPKQYSTPEHVITN